MSLRERLKTLIVEHPDWTSAQYARVLGTTKDSVRGALSAMKLSKHKPTKKKSKAPRPRPKVLPAKKPVTVVAKASSNRFGYTRLM